MRRTPFAEGSSQGPKLENLLDPVVNFGMRDEWSWCSGLRFYREAVPTYEVVQAQGEERDKGEQAAVHDEFAAREHGRLETGFPPPRSGHVRSRGLLTRD